MVATVLQLSRAFGCFTQRPAHLYLQVTFQEPHDITVLPKLSLSIFKLKFSNSCSIFLSPSNRDNPQPFDTISDLFLLMGDPTSNH